MGDGQFEVKHFFNCILIKNSMSKLTLPLPVSLNNEDELKSHFFSPQANWLIPNLVLVGESPSWKKNTAQYLQAVREDAGCGTFVCLQSEVPPQSDDATSFGGFDDWRTAEGANETPDYGNAAASVKINDKLAPKPSFLHYGLKDEAGSFSIESLDSLVTELAKRLEGGEILYIHCKGGKGRTGIIAASLLMVVYPDMDVEEVLLRCQKYCELRWTVPGKWLSPKVKSPATEVQFQAVRDYFNFRQHKN